MVPIFASLDVAIGSGGNRVVGKGARCYRSIGPGVDAGLWSVCSDHGDGAGLVDRACAPGATPSGATADYQQGTERRDGFKDGTRNTGRVRERAVNQHDRGRRGSLWRVESWRGGVDRR